MSLKTAEYVLSLESGDKENVGYEKNCVCSFSSEGKARDCTLLNELPK